MDIRFWPSLELIAQVKLAQTIIKNFKFETFHTNFLDKDGKIHRYWCLMVDPILSEFHLPSKIEIKIISIIRVLATEIRTWWNCHKEFLFVANLNCWERIRWFSHGTIDYFETARAFVKDENLNIKQRFAFGCKYYFEDDVPILWENMSEEDRGFIWKKMDMTNSMRIWMDALQRNIALDWSEVSYGVEIGHLIRTGSVRSFFFKNYLGLFDYFMKLKNSEARFQYLSLAIGRRSIHPFYLYSCLIQMEKKELDNMFKRLNETERCIVMESFLRWPLQCIFLDVLNRFQSNINRFEYLKLFKFLLCEKIALEWFDYEYVSLVRYLWFRLPEKIKNIVEQDNVYPCLQHVLSYNGRDPIPIHIIQDYSNAFFSRPELVL